MTKGSVSTLARGIVCCCGCVFCATIFFFVGFGANGVVVGVETEMVVVLAPNTCGVEEAMMGVVVAITGEDVAVDVEVAVDVAAPSTTPLLPPPSCPLAEATAGRGKDCSTVTQLLPDAAVTA